MLNVLQLEKINKEDVLSVFNDQLELMNHHAFDKLKKTLNKKGLFDDVYKRKL